jgi:hypothetical protein
MIVTKYKDNYCLTSNYIAVGNQMNIFFMFDYYSYPLNKKLYNTGIWHVKYKIKNMIMYFSKWRNK